MTSTTAEKLTTTMKSLDSAEEFPDMLPDTSSMFKRWRWNDVTNTLEQISTGLQPDKQILNFGKMKKGYKPVVPGGKGINNTIQLKSTRKSMQPTRKTISPNASSKLGMENRRITLDDVKRVSFELMSEEEYEFSELFEETLQGNHLDQLLSILLIYFKAFFEKISLERKPKAMMGYELSTAEKKACSLVTRELEQSQKMLGEKYCILILGLDSEKQHHMACGKQRKSFTKKDKDFYESLYSFCCRIIWITFRRTDLELIQEELGRLFRSQAYNPYGRPVDDHEFRLAYELTKLDIQDISLAPKSIRKSKRPPIQSILNQRSPVLVSLLPNSKESASTLLDRRTALPLNNKKEMQEDSILPNVSPTELCVGIIGESISGFNSNMLTPFGDDVEDEKDERKVSIQVDEEEFTLDSNNSESRKEF